MRRRTIVVIAASLGAVALVGGLVIAGSSTAPPPVRPPSATPTPSVMAAPYEPPSAEVLSALPEAAYDAVIPGLMGFASSVVPEESRTAYHLASDAPLYGTDRATPVARLAQKNFLLENTIVVPVEVDGDWTRVLTPSRQTLPSQSAGGAPAQTAAWLRTSLLVDPQPTTGYVSISVSAQTLTILGVDGEPTASFDVGVGTADAATPTGVVGYLQARYLDPAQGQTVHPIELTSLHSAAADEPYRGSDGGLIGLHFQETATGAVSHGCVRLDTAAITAVNALPMGTPVLITA